MIRGILGLRKSPTRVPWRIQRPNLKIKNFKTWKAGIRIWFFSLRLQRKQLLKQNGYHPGLTYSAVGHETHIQNYFKYKNETILFNILDANAIVSFTRIRVFGFKQLPLSFQGNHTTQTTSLWSSKCSINVGWSWGSVKYKRLLKGSLVNTVWKLLL